MADISKTSHRFCSEARGGVVIDGVSDVVSFDETNVVLESICGNMAIEGEGLHITVLNIDSGRVEITGKINGIFYFDNTPAPKKRLFGR